jgi:membrane protein
MVWSWAVSSAVERYLDTVEVSGSIPLSPTIYILKAQMTSKSKILRLFLRPIRIFIEALFSFGEDSGLVLSSSVSFYLLLAIVPVILFTLSLLGMLLSQQHYADQLSEILKIFVANPDTINTFTRIINPIIDNATSMTVWGSFALIFVSGGMFRSMEYAMNKVFNAKSRGLLRSYGIGMIFSLIINLLLIIGLVASPILGYATLTDIPVIQTLVAKIPMLAWIFQNIFSWFVFGLLCLIIYYVLPNTKKRFRDVFYGAVASAILWNILRYFFSIYLAYFSTIDFIYGALGTIIGAIVWLFLSVIIIIFGAEITRILGLRAQGQPAPSFTSLIQRVTSSFSPRAKKRISTGLEKYQTKMNGIAIKKK